MLLILGISFIIFLILGIPIAFVLGLTSFVGLLYSGDIPLLLIPKQMFSGTDSFPLLAVPFFILAGNLMNIGGITKRLIHFCNILLGHVRGGLALVNVVASMFFAGVTGAAVADTSALGSILIPAMTREKYDRDFSAAVTAASSTVGPIIPPSIPMVILGTVGELSVGALFLAGVVPGILVGLSLLVVAYVISVKRDYPKEKRKSLKEFFLGLKDALLALLMPAIIMGGILGGIFTPTEAAVVAVFYAFLVSFLVYREIRWKDLPRVLIDSVVVTSIIMFVIANSAIFGWILANHQVPQAVAHIFLSITNNKWVLLLLINLFLLFVGTFMETTASLIILTPILLPLAVKVGIDPIHFGLVMVLNLVIGLITPPLGVCLFIACSIARITLEQIVKAILPFLIAAIGVLFIVTYIPELVLWLPRMVMK
ncbi:MAG: TRAP transporter large permease [Deltaproteobacteria bacterium]|nr:TRAP transporter large permease [Deltaproteobacteria bacterium]MBM4324753.1 TRAP transporter large permease [Deltaproteobacteria bacterium]